jgi:hypothetical protein
MSLFIDKIGISGPFREEPKKQANVCRIDLPGGGVMEVRTRGNIQFDVDDSNPIKLARTDYPMSAFEANFNNYFDLVHPKKPDPFSEAK